MSRPLIFFPLTFPALGDNSLRQRFGRKVKNFTFSTSAECCKNARPVIVCTSTFVIEVFMSKELPLSPIVLVQQLQALSQTGLTYARDVHDIKRYESLREIATNLMTQLLEMEPHVVLGRVYCAQQGYATPKIDARAVIVCDDKVLLVKEADDGGWSLPGGWVDVGDSPCGAIRREVWEETGLEVVTNRLIGVWDRNQHGHPPYPWHVYKLFFHCTETGGSLQPGEETADMAYFSLDNLPPLSLTRVVPEEIFTSMRIINENGEPWCD
jgi:ADP-ribose pyrophosphatase YjhB (NUDIX family)